MTFSRAAFSNRFLESGRPLYGPRRDRRDAASDDVSEDSELELDDGDDGEPGDFPESEDEEEVVPLDEFDSFAADMLAFSTEDVERANLISLRIFRDIMRSFRSCIPTFGRSANWLWTRRRRLAPLGIGLGIGLALRLATRLCRPGIGIDVLLAHSLHVCDQLVVCFC